MTRSKSFHSLLSLTMSTLLFAVSVSLAWAEDNGYDYEGTMKELQEAYAWYKKRNYGKARVMVDKLKDKVFGKSETGGLEYPTSVTLGIKYLDKLLKDKKGYFNRLDSITGIAGAVQGGNAGIFEVKGQKETLSFIYERDVLIVGDDAFGGRRVTVYYNSLSRFGSSYTALKIVVHPQGGKK
jgi:hypothetical protein